MAHITVHIPSYGNPDWEMAVSLFMGAIPHAHKNGHTVRFFLEQGDSLIERARSKGLATWLQEPEGDYFFTWDQDIQWPSEILSRFVAHNLPIVGGIYRIRMADRVACAVRCFGTFAQDRKAEQEKLIATCNEVRPVWGLGTGGMMIRRDAAVAITEWARAHEPDLACTFSEVDPRDKLLQPVYRPFVHHWVEDGWREYLGEDYAFCRRAWMAGIPVKADWFMRGTHFGKFGYGW